MTEREDYRASCVAFLREGEELSEPFDWTIRKEEPAWVVEAGWPEPGDSFNGFADGWGPTPDEAYRALMWKLVQRRTAGQILWPYGYDWHTSRIPDEDEAAKVRFRRSRALTERAQARYDAEYQPERLR